MGGSFRVSRRMENIRVDFLCGGWSNRRGLGWISGMGWFSNGLVYKSLRFQSAKSSNMTIMRTCLTANILPAISD